MRGGSGAGGVPDEGRFRRMWRIGIGCSEEVLSVTRFLLFHLPFDSLCAISSLLQRAVPCAIVLAALVTGCTVKAQPPLTAGGDECASAAPVHVVVGYSGQNLSSSVRQTVLRAVLEQLGATIRPGSPGLLVSAYALSNHSVDAEPVRLSLTCLPHPVGAVDLKQTPTFERARVLEANRKAAAQREQALVAQRHQFDSFRQQVLNAQPPVSSTDIWGFLALASDEFETVDALERHVVIVARDEDIQSTYCDGCHPLRGASVHFVAFDQPTPADQHRRRSDWTDWLRAVGASSTTFTRSSEPLPPLFHQPASADQEERHA